MGPLFLDVSSRSTEAGQTLLSLSPPSKLGPAKGGAAQDDEDDHAAPHQRQRPSWTCFYVSLALSSTVILSLLVVILVLTSTLPSCTHHQQRDGSQWSESMAWGRSRPLASLRKPTVLLISSDGFRFGYQWKVSMPNLDRLRINGTVAVPGIIPVYPTLTFPNHYSIVTGLYPAWHGIISNSFTDPDSGEKFHLGTTDPRWWLGEPLWETVVKNGLHAATYFWPGSDVSQGSWNCVLPYCHRYNTSVSYENRVDAVLAYFDLPDDEKPSFITLYFEEPDHTGHAVGPDDPHVNQAIQFVDKMLGRLLDGLDERGIFEDVSIILLGDHGMVSTCDQKIIYLEDFSPWVRIPHGWADSLSPVLALRPSSDVNVKDVYVNITQAMNSGQVPNSQFLQVYLKEDLPSRLHYSSSDRIQPIIGIVSEGYKIEMKRSTVKECAGTHGYDNDALSMHPIFVAHGPQFARGRQIQSFINVEIYNVISAILGIEGAANNGSQTFTSNILLPD